MWAGDLTYVWTTQGWLSLAGLRHHSDRGSPYAATDYQPVLGKHGIITSMSRTGNGWDNACVESVFGTLKRELVDHQRDAGRGETGHLRVYRDIL